MKLVLKEEYIHNGLFYGPGAIDVDNEIGKQLEERQKAVEAAKAKNRTPTVIVNRAREDADTLPKVPSGMPVSELEKQAAKSDEIVAAEKAAAEKAAADAKEANRNASQPIVSK